MADARGRDGRVAGTPSVVAMPGRPPVIINVNGKTVTINGDDATIARSEASGTPDFRILEVAAGASLATGDIFIENGSNSTVAGNSPGDVS
jgi:hypothetical protein